MMDTQNQTNPLAPLEPILSDPAVTEVMIDGYKRVYVERRGKLEDAPNLFHNDKEVMALIEAILAPLGLQVNESSPMVDARLADGTRVNIVIPPVALNGPTITMRKYVKFPLTIEDLIGFGSCSAEIFEFLRACIQSRLNIIIAGGTGSGKTTVLNLLAGMIPDNERIIVVQNTGELQLPQKYVVTLESRPPNLEGKGEVTLQDLLLNALRMRPDRLILSEARGAEVLTLLEAINTGHDGSMVNIHANSARDVLARLEIMVTYANPSIPLLKIREMIAAAINLIAYQERLPEGSRKILKVTEVVGMQGEAIGLTDIFEFRQTGLVDGKIMGYFAATGEIPKLLKRMQAGGVELPLSLFKPG